jgi:hypothetical protein
LNKKQEQTKDLYTAKDVKEVREQLIAEQKGLDLMTGEPLVINKTALDHNHDDEQFVRGVLSSSSNRALGKLESAWKIYLKSWYTGTLSDFLRKAATYLEREPDSRYRHPGWVKRINTLFNSLTEAQKEATLRVLNRTGSNGAKRKEEFKKAVLSKEYTYEYLRQLILSIKK